MSPLDIFGEPEEQRNIAADGMGFFDTVYSVVGRIPEGRVASYSAIARALGRPRAALVVGWALRAAGERSIPCHRVVRADGGLSPEDVFGAGVQRAMLEGEGITFTAKGCVDMGLHAWNPIL